MSDPIRYRDAGVDIDAGNAFVRRIQRIVARTQRPEVLSGLGGFGALFSANFSGMKDPVLVASTDGVGTKILLHERFGTHRWAGVDLVAMNVNDVVAQGAEPLFFLDYLACGRLDPELMAGFVEGMAEACVEAGCALIGGETAEMPDVYPEGRFDLAGFCVGVADKERLITGREIRAGDWVLGLASNGPHANGYSLIRKILERSRVDPEAITLENGLNAKEALVAPTRIYVREALALLRAGVPVHGLAHITGGGFYDNIARILPERCVAVLDAASWPVPEVFRWLFSLADVPMKERYRTFNMGIGFVVITPEAEAAERVLADLGTPCYRIGRIEQGAHKGVVIRGVDLD